MLEQGLGLIPFKTSNVKFPLYVCTSIYFEVSSSSLGKMPSRHEKWGGGSWQKSIISLLTAINWQKKEHGLEKHFKMSQSS